MFITLSQDETEFLSLLRHLPNYKLWQASTSKDKHGIAAKDLADIPHIVAWHFVRRHDALMKYVVEPHFATTDCWTRFEWQSRGSAHSRVQVHWVQHAHHLDLMDAQSERRFAQFWDQDIVVICPEPPTTRAEDMKEDSVARLAKIVNNAQVHKHTPYC